MLHNVIMCTAGLKLILDFIPNQTGLKHAWFNASRHGNTAAAAGGGGGGDANNGTFRDFYVWHPGKQSHIGTKRQPPNNWVSGISFKTEWTLMKWIISDLLLDQI